MGFGDFLNNVVNSIPGVGHVKGIAHGIVGDDEGARKAFHAANSCTSGVLNSIPGVGHAKGLVHTIAGDHEGAKEAYLSATRSTLVMGGAVLAGPAGAAAAAIGTGVAADSVVSLTTGKHVGYVKNLDTILDAKGVTDVISGVGKMALDVGCDVAAGSAGGAISAAARLPAKQVISHSSKQITQAVGKTVVRNTENQVVGYALDYRTSRRSSFIDSESDEEFDEYIYFFQCEENQFKVGRSDQIVQRLQTHERNYVFGDRPWVFPCRDSRSAERHILNDKQEIRRARIINVRETEMLDNRQVNMTPEAFKEFVLNEIRAVVARVNRGERW